jgi:TonB-linked SusC/RagA family outer membrane protein
MKKMNLLKKHAKRRCRAIAFFLFAFQLFCLNSSFSYASASISDSGQKPVAGTVTELSGAPLPGVSIIQKGTTNGTVTDADGKYTIEAPEGSTLVFSFIGFATKEITVSKEVINIVLEESVVSIDEVVAVGYGKLKSSQVSSSITRVTSEDIAVRPVARIDQAIQGKLAGVQVQEVSGSPGRSMAVRVRGTGSINYSTSPLYVVDGFPISGDLNSINPGDIQSIEVLKDAASASIYGSRGANGVILITTKMGQTGKPVIEFDSYSGLQERFSKVDVLNRDEYIEYAIEERTNSYIYSGGDLSVPEDKRHNYQHAIDPLWRTNPTSFPDHDWQSIIDRVAPIQSYTLSASGSSDNIKYYFSGNYFDQEGIILNSDYKRYSLRANIESEINKFFTLGMNLSGAYSIRNDPNTDTNQSAISRSILVAPIVGINQQTVKGGNYYYHAHFFLNPLALAKEINTESKNNHLHSNFYFLFSPIKNFTLKSSFGTDISSYKSDYFIHNNVNRDTGSRASVSNNLRQNFLSETTLNYDYETEDLSLNILGGYTFQKEKYESSYLEKTGFPDDDIKTLNAATTLLNGNSTAEEWSIISYLARANFSYLNKYVLTASIRRDGSSRFGTDNRWGLFPSVSAGWILSEEDFLSEIDKISNFKFRISYGSVGNNNIGNYSAIGLMKGANYIVGDSKLGGYSPSSFSNSDLGWETTNTADFGVDFGFYKNRINLTLDYYIANTRDLLLSVQIPQVTGFGNALQNIGKVQNKGFEVEILTKNLVNKFKWNTSFNFSTNQNEVKELGPDGSPIIGYAAGFPVTITRIGDPIGSYYLFETDGLFKNQADVDANKAMAYVSKNPSPGDLKYKDQNNDGEITVEHDKVIVGHNTPDFVWGLTNSFEFMGFDLSIFMDGQYGNKLLNIAKKETTQSRGNVRGYWRNRWKSESDPGNGIVPRAVTTTNLTTPSDWWLENASFWRIRNISLGYRIPQRIVNKIEGLTDIRITGSIDNVYMYDHYNHMSQTGVYSNSNLTPGVDYDTGYPLARTYKLGVNIKF